MQVFWLNFSIFVRVSNRIWEWQFILPIHVSFFCFITVIIIFIAIYLLRFMRYVLYFQFLIWSGKHILLWSPFVLQVASSWKSHTNTKMIHIGDLMNLIDPLCGLVVRVPGYRSRDPGFDFRLYQIFWEVVGLERGPLTISLVSTIEELLGTNSSGSGLENREYGRGDPLRWPRDTL
jgi:hypothetical protein